jgi:hypothetical protein
MAFALNPELKPGTLQNLIIADITPAKGDMSSEFQGYIHGMKRVQDSRVATRNQASEILLDHEKVRGLPPKKHVISIDEMSESFGTIGSGYSRVPLDQLDTGQRAEPARPISDTARHHTRCDAGTG